MNFAFHAILWTSIAAVAPVIIHLIMRSKPRRMTLPTLRFVKKTHRANLSKLKLKHIILLAMRMAAIVGVAFLLARPFLAGYRASAAAQAPVAVVVVVDNSASMGYRHQGRTLGDRGRDVAAKILADLPGGSRMAVISTGAPADGAGFVADSQLAGRLVREIPAGFGEAPLAPAATRAIRMLRDVDLPRKEVIIISDMTAHAWRDSGLLGGADCRFTIINCSIARESNVALGDVHLSASAVPLGAEVTLETTLQSSHLGGQMSLQVDLAGEAVDRREVLLPVGGVRSVSIPLRPRRRGLVKGRVMLPQPDGLAADNVRYFTLRVGPPAEVLIVATPGPRDDLTAFLMANAIAPPMPAATESIRRRTISPASLDKKALDAAPLVMLAGADSLRAEQWKLLADYLRAGGRVWVVAGSMMSADSYNTAAAQRVFPVKLTAQQQLSEAAGWQPPDTTLPMFEPFADPQNPPLADVRCFRRFGIESIASDADVALRFSDATPAIMTRTVGRGKVVFWNFSPTRSWSNLARLGQLVVLAGRTTELLLQGEKAPCQFACGQPVELPHPPAMSLPEVTVQLPGMDTWQPASTLQPARRQTKALKAMTVLWPMKPGNYIVAFTEGDKRIERGFSVNVPSAESDLKPLSEEKILSHFSPGRADVVATAEDRLARLQQVKMPLDLLPIVLLVLLVILTAESFFANRFYKQHDQCPNPNDQ